jgi:hypothetical protein
MYLVLRGKPVPSVFCQPLINPLSLQTGQYQ